MVLGNSVENRYALQSYGIPIDQFPISFSGKIKAKYAKQWVAARMAIEKAQAKGDPHDCETGRALFFGADVGNRSRGYGKIAPHDTPNYAR